MCGIIGYLGPREVVPVLINGLKSLEYRGYDSAGIAVLENHKLKVARHKGKIKNLEENVQNSYEKATMGIGHTRWATHGRPSQSNCHPHRDCENKIAVVHNGIIENYQELRQMLKEKGHKFTSDTDTEVIPHLIEEYYHGNLLEAVNAATKDLRGSYAMVVISQNHPDQLVAARKNSPLIIGIGQDEYFYASDIPAIIEYTKDIIILDDYETALLTPNGAAVFADMDPVTKKITTVDWDCGAVVKGDYEHFMLKEINEQPDALRNILEGRISKEEDRIILDELNLSQSQLQAIDKIQIVACGTAYHAGIVGKYIMEDLLRKPVEVDIASEFRYRNPILSQESLVIVISQSGETADTLAALEESRSKGAHVVAITNVEGSSISRNADSVIYTKAGPEIAVASTKAYITQLAALYMLTLYLGKALGKLEDSRLKALIREFLTLPPKVELVIKEQAENIQELAKYLLPKKDCFFVGRGLDYAVSLEGSLKLKEISYIHAEAYASGELKHGTLALLTPAMPVIAVCTQRSLTEKSVSNIKEIKARDSFVIGIAFKGMEKDLQDVVDTAIYLPETADIFAPILAVVPLQMLSYYAALVRGCDVDQPRNLAKSVTVE